MFHVQLINQTTFLVRDRINRNPGVCICSPFSELSAKALPDIIRIIDYLNSSASLRSRTPARFLVLVLLEQEPSHRREYTVTNEEETISKLIRENERDILLEYLHYTFY